MLDINRITMIEKIVLYVLIKFYINKKSSLEKSSKSFSHENNINSFYFRQFRRRTKQILIIISRDYQICLLQSLISEILKFLIRTNLRDTDRTTKSKSSQPHQVTADKINYELVIEHALSKMKYSTYICDNSDDVVRFGVAV